METRFSRVVMYIDQAAAQILLNIEHHSSDEPRDVSEDYGYYDLETLADRYVKRARREISRVGAEPDLIEYVRTEHHAAYIERLEEILLHRCDRHLEPAADAAIACTFERCVLMAVVREAVYPESDEEDFERDFEHFMVDDYPMVNETFKDLVESNIEYLEAKQNREGCREVFNGAFGQY